MELSKDTQELINAYTLAQKPIKPEQGPTIHVDEVAMKVAAFYEHIRTIIDWQEEHLIRRSAIIRKLKRRFLDLELNNFSVENMAESLVMELIRGGYFPNDKLEESKIGQVQSIIEKYVFILKNSPENKKGRAGLQFYTKLLEIASCEIEEKLAPALKEMALIEYMFSKMKERIQVSELIYKRNFLQKEDKDIQIYIAVHQALFKLDSPIISYNLLKYKFTQWDNPSEEELFKVSQNIYKILKGIESDLSHILGKKFYTICEKYDTPYLLLGDILAHNPEAKKEFDNPTLLEQSVRNAYNKRLKDLKAKINRAAFYSTLSIFITKMLSLVILEVILARIFEGHLNLLSLVSDIVIPTALMAFLVLTVRPPTRRNSNVVIVEAMKIVYPQQSVDAYEIKIARKRGLITSAILSLIYLLGACVSFGGIYFIFNYLQFPITSIIINIIFIALILFAGTAIQKRSQELTIEEESEGFMGFVSDVLFLPIAGIGRWLSHTWRQYNAITAFFNALIDMPFSSFVEFLERWRYFIKEKKEELR